MNPNPNEWPKVARVAWLGGGLAIVSNPCTAEVTIGCGLDGPIVSTLKLPSFGSLFGVAGKLGARVIGATFFESPDEVEGLVPPQFRAYSAKSAWRVWEVRQQWGQVAFAASRRDMMALTDIASRLSSGLDHCEMRLAQLAAAYGKQLRYRAQKKELGNFVRFQDINSPPVYMAIHALFWELAVLRDTLAEFAAKYAFKLEGVATMRGLVARLRSSKIDTPLADEFVTMAGSAPEGWVEVFTAYRNLFTHAAPMQKVAGVAFTVQHYLKAPKDVRLPAIYYPLPGDAKDLMQRRSKGDLFSTLDALVKASAGRKPDPASEPDALDYLSITLERFGELATNLIELSPLAPKMIELTEADISGPITIVRR